MCAWKQKKQQQQQPFIGPYRNTGMSRESVWWWCYCCCCWSPADIVVFSQSQYENSTKHNSKCTFILSLHTCISHMHHFIWRCLCSRFCSFCMSVTHISIVFYIYIQIHSIFCGHCNAFHILSRQLHYTPNNSILLSFGWLWLYTFGLSHACTHTHTQRILFDRFSTLFTACFQKKCVCACVYDHSSLNSFQLDIVVVVVAIVVVAVFSALCFFVQFCFSFSKNVNSIGYYLRTIHIAPSLFCFSLSLHPNMACISRLISSSVFCGHSLFGVWAFAIWTG